MDMNIDEKTYSEIAGLISSDASPVGIDAKKTHVYIINMLMRIDKRLAVLEKESSQHKAD